MRVHDPGREAPPTGHRFCLVASRFNQAYVERMVTAAAEVLRRRGVPDDALELVWVPGSFELPLACRWAADTGRFAAVLAFGLLIRGQTEHFRLVAEAATHGIERVALDTGVPVLNGILATHDAEQAAARTGGELGNRGAEGALAALQMAGLRAGFGTR